MFTEHALGPFGLLQEGLETGCLTKHRYLFLTIRGAGSLCSGSGDESSVLVVEATREPPAASYKDTNPVSSNPIMSVHPHHLILPKPTS